MFILSLDGILFPIITIAATAVVAILAYVAQALARSGDLFVEIKRHAFISADDVRLGIRFSSTKNKVHEFHNIAIAVEEEGNLKIISEKTYAPIAMEDESRLLSTTNSGYRIAVKDGASFEGVFHFVISKEVNAGKITTAYLVAVDKNGQKVKAPFDFKSTEAQSVHFRKVKEKKSKK